MKLELRTALRCQFVALDQFFFVDKDVSIFNKISNVPFKLSFHFSFDKESERERENEKNLITHKSSLS